MGGRGQSAYTRARTMPQTARRQPITINVQPPTTQTVIQQRPRVLANTTNFQDFTQMSDVEFFNRQYKTEQKAWENGLTADETNSIKNFCAFGFTSMNQVLYGAQAPTAAVVAKIDNMKNAINKYNLKEGITVIRGQSKSMFNGVTDVNKLQQMVGADWTTPAFMSTTADTKAVFTNKDMYLKIHIPPGTGRGAYVRNFSKYKKEKEFVTQAGSTFHIDSVTMYQGKPLIELTMY